METENTRDKIMQIAKKIQAHPFILTHIQMYCNKKGENVFEWNTMNGISTQFVAKVMYYAHVKAALSTYFLFNNVELR